MAIMTFRTVRNISVFVVVTNLAVLLRVSARELLQLSARSGMTIGTDRSNLFHRRSQLRSMRVLVALKTVDLDLPMGFTMTSCTRRHQIFVIVFARAVGVKNLMTLLAGEAMLAT